MLSADRISALWRHVIPFAAWLLLMELLPAAAWSYALRSILCLALLLWLRPWRFYTGLRGRHLPAALLTGVGVFVLWVLPESTWFRESWPALNEAYRRFAMIPPWETAAAVSSSSLYAPQTAGWLLAATRVAGSALVIAPIEEFFWRGFLYRWLIERDFTRVSLACLRLGPLLGMVALFGIEHQRWFVGALAGLAYGLLMIRTDNLWAPVVAHTLTNLLLGLYVLATGNYLFW